MTALVMDSVRFTVPGNPVPKQRPRVVKGHTYTPVETQRAEQWIAMHARRARVRWTEGQVKLHVSFYRDSGHACDLDNLVKTVADALNGIAWKDDRQIVWLGALKAVDRENPRTEVEISEVNWGEGEP